MKKRCIRKHWKLVNPIEYAINGATAVSDSELNKIRILELTAIDAFTKGQATKEDWRQIADMVNISEAMTEDGIGKDEVLPAVKAAQDALEQAHRRFTEKGVLGLSGLEIQALRELYQWHDLQRTSINRSRYEKAIQRVCNKVRSAAKDVRRFV
jgi:hypothetical protein